MTRRYKPTTASNSDLLKRLRSEIKRRRMQTKEKHSRRVDGAYPHPDKPRVRYITIPNILLAVVVLVALGLLGHLYWFTAGVYVDTFAALSDTTEIARINLGSEWLSRIWLLGPVIAAPLFWIEELLNGFETTSMGLLGLIIYIILQTTELTPTVVWESPHLMFFLIRKFDSHKKIKHLEGDSEGLRRLKTRHNEYYDNFLHTLEDLRLICYIIDASICFFLVKFVNTYQLDEQGNRVLVRFLEAAGNLTFGLADLDPTATIRVLSSLFLLWFALKLTMRLQRGFQLFANREESDV